MHPGDDRILRLLPLALAALVLVPATGCGPAFRFRSPETLHKGDVEVGGSLGVAGRTQPQDFGGAEIAAWLRGGASEHVEIGGRFWTYTASTFGGAFELRLQPIKKPIAFSVDLGFQGAFCCGAGNAERQLGAGLGWDAGVTVGGRIGGEHGPAPYFAPHFNMTFTIESVLNSGNRAGRQDLLFLPVGVDIPLGKSPLRLRPEFLAALHFQPDIAPQARLGGGLALAVQGPGFEKIRKMNQAKKEAREAGATP